MKWQSSRSRVARTHAARKSQKKWPKELGYSLLSRDILLQASEEFNIPEIRLVRALHDAPSVLERFTHGKERYVSFIQQALLEQVQGDNLVYHGLAGHFFLRGVGHVLKVRIIADMEDRVRLEMSREGISEKEARRILKKDDEERRHWALSLYGIDTLDSSLYDLVINVREMEVECAVGIICHTAVVEPVLRDHRRLSGHPSKSAVGGAGAERRDLRMAGCPNLGGGWRRLHRCRGAACPGNQGS